MIHDFMIMNTTTIMRNVDMNLVMPWKKSKQQKSDVAKYLRTKNGSTKNADTKDMNCENFLIKNIEIL